MRAFLFFLVFSVIGFSSLAQTDLFKSKPKESTKYPRRLMLTPAQPVPQGPEGNVPNSRNVLQLKVEIQKIGAISATTDLYKIKGYNMPCIAPSVNIKNNMPVIGKLQDDKNSPNENLVEKPKD